MHILFLTDNFPPEVNAPASRTHEHCREWVRAGHLVTVITTAPNFPSGVVHAGYRNALWHREEMDGIQVVRVFSYITANSGTVRRTLDYVSFGVAAVLGALFVRRVDVVVGTSPQFFTACAAAIVGALKRVPWVFEVRDLWPESIKVVGAIKNGAVLRLLERIELLLYRRASAIVAVTHAIRESIAARGVAREKIHVVTNGADVSRFSPRPKDILLEAKLGLVNKFVVGYVGTLGMAHALDTVLSAARTVGAHPKGGHVHFVLLGDGAERERLVARAEREGISNVTFLSTVPKAQVARYWSLLDAAVIHLKRDPLFASVIPSKLFEAMAMGIPVLHGVAGESAEIVQREGVGVTFPPEDADALAQAVLQLAHDDLQRIIYRAHAIDAAKRYDRSALAARMLTVLTSLERDASHHGI